jgi:hypothetical protein
VDYESQERVNGIHNEVEERVEGKKLTSTRMPGNLKIFIDGISFGV